MADAFPTALQRTSDERWVSLEVVARVQGRMVARIAEDPTRAAVVSWAADDAYGQHLRRLLESPPPAPGRGVHLTWPDDLLHDLDARVVGYTAPRSSSGRTFPLGDYVDPATRSSIAPMATRRHHLRVARNVATAIAAVHHAGHGRVRGRQFRIDEHAGIVLVHADSLVSDATPALVVDDERRLGHLILRLVGGRPWAAGGSIASLISRAEDPRRAAPSAIEWFHALRDAERDLPPERVSTAPPAAATRLASATDLATALAQARHDEGPRERGDGRDGGRGNGRHGGRNGGTGSGDGPAAPIRIRVPDHAPEPDGGRPSLERPIPLPSSLTVRQIVLPDRDHTLVHRTGAPQPGRAPGTASATIPASAAIRSPAILRSTADARSDDHRGSSADVRSTVDIRSMVDVLSAAPATARGPAPTPWVAAVDPAGQTRGAAHPAIARAATATATTIATTTAATGAVSSVAPARQVASRQVASRTTRPARGVALEPASDASRLMFALAASLVVGGVASVAPFATFLLAAIAMCTVAAVSVGRRRATMGPAQTVAITVTRLVPFATGGLAFAAFILLDLLLLLGLVMAVAQRVFDYGPGFTLGFLFDLPEVPLLVRGFAFVVGGVVGASLGGGVHDRLHAAAGGRMVTTPALALSVVMAALLVDAGIVWWPLPLL